MIIITRCDISLFGLEQDIALEIKQVKLTNIRMLCSIGEPVPYMMYFHNVKRFKGRISQTEKEKLKSQKDRRPKTT